MTCSLIDGKAIAARIRSGVKAEVEALKAAHGLEPGLDVILVGDDAASHVYVSSKVKACSVAGIRSRMHHLPSNTTPEGLMALIESLNADDGVHGILLQLPLPDALRPMEPMFIQAISPLKDVDGLHPLNAGYLFSGTPTVVPCTPQGALLLIKEVMGNLTGMHAVIIGRSQLFGKPMGPLLLAENCTVTQAHSRTRDLPALCRQADILVVAVGQPDMVKGDWVKPGAIVIDVGINRIEAEGGSKLVGDVDFDAAEKVAGAITPVPGGVGPMTIACLLLNTVKLAMLQAKI